MTELVEVAIEKALLDRAQSFATTNSITISLPNIAFTPPAVGQAAKYLKASVLPADNATIGVSNSSSNQYLGLLQIDVFYGKGGGERAPKRIAADIVEYFARGTRMVVDGFKIEVLQTPRLAPLIHGENWVQLPVRIPYNCFAIPAVAG